jgi:beta-lactamase class A
MRIPKRIRSLLCCLGSVAILGAVPARAASQQAGRKPSLERLLLAASSRIPADVGIYVKHLTTGEEIAIRADEVFNSASTRKVGIMIMAFQKADRGELDLGERIRVDRAAMQSGSGVLQYHDFGTSLTLRDLITEMIITSDNTATYLVINKLGGKQSINAWFGAQGYEQTRTTMGTVEVNRTLYATLGDEFAKLTDEEIVGLERMRSDSPLYAAYADLFKGSKQALADRFMKERARLTPAQSGITPADRRSWTGSTSAREMGRLLESIERGTAASAASSAAMREILLRQQLGARRIPHYLQGVRVAHKTGDSGTVANDVGIIYTPSGPVVVSFIVTGIRGVYGEAEDQIGQMARMIVEYFG